MSKLDDKVAQLAVSKAAARAGIKDVDCVSLVDMSTVMVGKDGSVIGADEAVAALRRSRPHLFEIDWASLSPADFRSKEQRMLDRVRDAAAGSDDRRRAEAKIPAIDSSTLNPEQFDMLDRYVRGHATVADVMALSRIAKQQEAA